MFPLGSVLFPGMPLPLQIFEMRYQLMLADVLANDGTFGVVLIQRGSEVGGGDIRSNTGTLARIIRHEPRSRGRHSILAVGVERIRVNSWMPDDPYPLAEVEPWPDEFDDAGTTDDPTDLTVVYGSCVESLRELLATAASLGHHVVPATFATPDDPVAGSNFLGSIAPLGPFDRQRLLEAPGASHRLMILSEMISEQMVLITGDLGPDI